MFAWPERSFPMKSTRIGTKKNNVFRGETIRWKRRKREIGRQGCTKGSLHPYKTSDWKPYRHHSPTRSRDNVHSNEAMIGSAVFPHFNRATLTCLLLCVLYLLSAASGEYEGRESSSSVSNDRTSSNEFGSCTDGKCIKRTSQDITSGMWFGPRLGRRRRADRKPEADLDFEALTNALDGSRWAVITIPGAEKRQPTQFTPRLGRESGEEFFSYGFPKDQEELYAEEQIFPPLFAPRLGRRVPWTPSPRLGRQLHNILEKSRQNYDDPRY